MTALTESEWLSADSAPALLAHLGPRISDRQRRLWVFAMAARARGLAYAQDRYGKWEEGLADAKDRDGTPESLARDWAQFPDEEITSREQCDLLREIVGNPFRVVPSGHPCPYCHAPMRMEANHRHQLGLWYCTQDRTHVTRSVTLGEMRQHETALSASLCGNPDHGSVAVRPTCSACNRFRTPVSLGLAHSVWQDRLADGTLNQDLLSALADALERLGCPSGPTLGHLRGVCAACEGDGCHRHPPIGFVDCRPCGGSGRAPVPHVRGCWALDSVLGLT